MLPLAALRATWCSTSAHLLQRSPVESISQFKCSQLVSSLPTCVVMPWPYSCRYMPAAHEACCLLSAHRVIMSWLYSYRSCSSYKAAKRQDMATAHVTQKRRLLTCVIMSWSYSCRSSSTWRSSSDSSACCGCSCSLQPHHRSHPSDPAASVRSTALHGVAEAVLADHIELAKRTHNRFQL